MTDYMIQVHLESIADSLMRIAAVLEAGQEAGQEAPKPRVSYEQSKAREKKQVNDTLTATKHALRSADPDQAS